MSLSQHKIKAESGSQKSKKRVGRGNASGHGTYSTRGLKGQKSRSGVSNLKRLGMRQLLLKTPKKRGFTSLQEKSPIVGLDNINLAYKDGETVTVKDLFEKGLIATPKLGAKILGNGQLTVSNLTFEGTKVSKSAKEQIDKTKGKIIMKKKVNKAVKKSKKSEK
ncbi:MAG: LSU ribosomal protein L15p (L27Ae) [Candidatus Falkowbacteria bacterium GW2011_GWC2_38_22]|uniref:Large ribosomal subunit protein uL15 n=1 Tax=Candidatus Falkowbacteria bacterium GW2011_GWE1_38_31 TaxID=1618638 RepID=A0A0G0K3K0_9BACT|nr:MAG: LSU ribosomal protein L15p (L27Ae) [Candidatus Falkowbacteria bacterium GW2011_GWF2_38_1205]KKQ61174.1 MAG: LSU ribosomal protein L15p (L27Ae) [Candidatus Falkowbacteria bacterium GW2011_GWC2_38_22]KKQ63318.1 MAG: LSU ribosomal protein L15p (L27Ae) [Candidatus Falkowbacteria bacterium GW2011_GWF1_38_22]KKQ65564.1 MAG: LSU ribosomal protein L15p (L27Ae) [Candidatus Falkowbacteria bacterium GW2011_GWE2_38_254]KKQ70050.1 MAG: LSU ribosomal protein L15p (L27Ae) [Candidatus Falkowbacteria ba